MLERKQAAKKALNYWIEYLQGYQLKAKTVNWWELNNYKYEESLIRKQIATFEKEVETGIQHCSCHLIPKTECIYRKEPYGFSNK